MTSAQIVHADPSSEHFFDEGCHITEWWNSPADPQASIARARLEPGMTTRWHCLHGVTERYVILSGAGLAEVGEMAQTVTAGSVVLIPPGVAQRITCLGEQDLVFLAVCTPRFGLACYKDLQDEAEMPASS